MSTKNYVSPKCDDVSFSLEGTIMAGSSLGVSIDSFSADQTDYSDGWSIIN